MQLAQRLILNLPDPLVGAVEFGSDLVESADRFAVQSEPEAQHFLFAFRQGFEQGEQILHILQLDQLLVGSRLGIVLKEILKFAAVRINNHPSGRGGYFSMSGHCARQFIVQGEKTSATPDGRKEGEEFSKNLSPTMGADTNGLTALSRSICAMDYHDLPGDFPLDVMLHPATVQGEEGLEAMKHYLFSHYANGGLQIHFNVFDAQTLIDAKAHPEKYSNLQVRVCGWNVRFVELNEKEQDMYITRALRIAE